jgi:hypothetical protein
MNKINPTLYLLCICALFIFLHLQCAENEPLAPKQETIQLETTIKSGPAEGVNLPNNSTVSFNWDGVIRPGEITSFSYSFEEIINDTTYLMIASDSALIRSYSKANLTDGHFRFTVCAHAVNGDSSYTDKTPAVRHFSVIADTLAPEITLLQAPKAGSYAISGSSVFLEWIATDPSPGGEIISYSYTLADTSVQESELDWSLPRLETTQIAYYKLPDAVYRFWIRATDISGLSTITSHLFTIKPADILFVIDQSLNTYEIDFWHQHVLRDFSYEDFYLTSDPADFLAKLDPLTYSTIVWAANDWISTLPGEEFSDVLAAGSLAEGLKTYLDDGGHLWISGSEIIFNLGVYNWPPMDYPDGSFVNDVLHIQFSAESDSNFYGCTNTGIGNYNDLLTNGGAIFSYCDRVDPVEGEAETILNFVSADTNFTGQSVAIRYPAGADEPGDTKIIYCGFYLADLNEPEEPWTLRPSDIYQFATTVFTAFGENLD